jgi:hypothetical protein
MIYPRHMDYLEEASQFELEGTDLFNQLVEFGTRTGAGGGNPVHRTIVCEVEDSGAADRVWVFLLDVLEGELPRHKLFPV